MGEAWRSELKASLRAELVRMDKTPPPPLAAGEVTAYGVDIAPDGSETLALGRHLPDGRVHLDIVRFEP